ncbi:MAG: YtxH domain-containing protein [Maribacter sp.]|uniref:YtxH domain-containing protein n=1 Tax=Maribacter sp. TaxID=1897614 RepID=UPI003C764998
MNNTGNTLLAIIAGSAIGAALGVLFAPDKGEVTRRKIADQATATKESITNNAMDLKDRVVSKISSESETLETRMEGIVSDVSYKTEDVITTLERKLAALKNKNKKLQKTS